MSDPEGPSERFCSCDTHTGPAVHRDLLFLLHASWTSVQMGTFSVSKQSLGEPCGSVGDLFSLSYRGSAWHMVGRQGIGKVHRSPRQSRAGKVARERWGWPWVPSSTGSWPTGLCQPRPLPQQSHWWLVSTSLEVSEATIPCHIRVKNQPQECPC